MLALVLMLLLVLPAAAFAGDVETASGLASLEEPCVPTVAIGGSVPEQRGCCSWHSGVCGCSLGRLVCCDGAYSPSCTCKGTGPEVGAVDEPVLLAGDVSVKGYFRRDGTYVQPHMRSTPDNSYNNNWSTYPNVNPYTGQQGTKQPRLYDNNDRGLSGSGTWGLGGTQKPSRSLFGNDD